MANDLIYMYSTTSEFFFVLCFLFVFYFTRVLHALSELDG